MSDIEDRLRQLAREIGGPNDSSTDAARRRIAALVGDHQGGQAPVPSRPRRRPRICRRRGLLVLAGAVVVGAASALGITSLGGGGAAAPVACQLFADRGAGPQQLNFYAPSSGVSDSGDAVISWVARGGSIQAVTRVGDSDWGQARAVSPQLPKNFLPRSVTLDMAADGQALLGWTSQATQVVDWTPGAGWGAPQTLRDPSFRTSPYEPPKLALTDAGDAAALWMVGRQVRYLTGGGASIANPFPILARRAPGEGWRTAAALGGPRGRGPGIPPAGRRAQWHFAPEVVLGDDGTTTLIGSGSFLGTAYQQLSPSGAVSAGGLADPRQSYNVGAAGIDARGDVTALWMRGTNLVAGTLRAGSGTWQSRVVANTGLYSADFSLAVSRGGDAVVAFRGRARGVRGTRFPARAPTARPDRDIQALSYSAATGRWTQAIRLSATGVPATSPRVAIDGGGQATVAWVQGPNNGQGLTRIMAAHGSSGSWTPAAAISAPTPDPVAPALAVADGGRALVAWTGCRGGEAGVYLSERNQLEWSKPEVVG